MLRAALCPTLHSRWHNQNLSRRVTKKNVQIRADIRGNCTTGEQVHVKSCEVNVPIKAKLKQKTVKVHEHVFISVTFNVMLKRNVRLSSSTHFTKLRL